MVVENQTSEKHLGPNDETLAESFRLVCLCATTQVSDDRKKRIRKVLETGTFSWPLVLSQSLYHRVEPLLLKTMTDHFIDSVPENILEYLKKAKDSSRYRTLFLVNENDRICKLFSENGIPVLTVKGPTLGQVAYGDIHLRPFSDLDLLLGPDGFRPAKKLLEQEGYVPFNKLLNMTGLRERLYLWQSRQYQFTRAKGLFNLDVHLDLLPPFYSFPIPFKEMYERRVHVKIGTSLLPSFSPEDLFLILCFHCVKNRWERLKHMVDIAEFVNHQPELDWNRILLTSHKLRCEKIFLVSLALTQATVGLELPKEVLQRLDAYPKLQDIANRAVIDLPDRLNVGIATFKDRLRDNLTVLDTQSGKMRYIAMAVLRRMSDWTGSNIG